MQHNLIKLSPITPYNNNKIRLTIKQLRIWLRLKLIKIIKQVLVPINLGILRYNQNKSKRLYQKIITQEM